LLNKIYIVLVKVDNVYWDCLGQGGANESRWASRTSNPSGGMNSVFGGFDSHTPPPASKTPYFMENLNNYPQIMLTTLQKMVSNW
jgi:hypothetical protein